MTTMRQYTVLPDLPTRGPLPPIVGVIVPVARTNLVTNPSFETGTTGWTASGGSISRTSAAAYHGVYSLSVALSNPSTVDGVYYTIGMVGGTTYAASVKFRAFAPGLNYVISVATSAGVELTSYQFTATRRWQWVSVIWQETTNATRRIYIRKNDTRTDTQNGFLVDGLQVEAISDSYVQASTYIDGDQQGLLNGQYPAPYAWNGTPHASTSYRTALTRAGGVVLNWQRAYSFLLTGMIGLGLATPNNVSIPYSVLDGARYVRTTKPPRTISFSGRFQADSLEDLAMMQSAMHADLDRDRGIVQQPLLLQVEPQDDCEHVIGDFATLQCLYAGGLEGNQPNYPIEEAAPTFTMYLPYLYGGDAGTTLTTRQNVTNANYIVQRSGAGVWAAMGTGGNNIVQSLAYGVDGTLYAGGSFTDMGGTGADYLAQWNGSAWAVVGSATALGGLVAVLYPNPSGGVYLGGAFINAGGNADADRIAYWDGATYNNLGTGMNSGVNALAVGSDGALYAGGAFTNAGGTAANRVAKWDGSVWSALGAGISGGGAQVNALAVGLDGALYVGGDFTTAGATSVGYIAKWDGSAWSALGTGLDGPVYSLAVAPDGTIYIGGDFTTAGGVSAIGVAQWNGSSYTALSSGLGGTGIAYALRFDAAGMLYVGGDFTTAGGMSITDRAARWNGSTWLPLDINLPGSAIVYAIAARGDGAITLGTSTSGTAVSGVSTQVLNGNRTFIYPTFRITAPTSAVGTIYQIVNLTTGGAIYFQGLTLAANEQFVLDTTPQTFRFVSNLRGDLTSFIAPGSTNAQLYLAPGLNTIVVYGTTSEAIITWQRRYMSYADLVQ